VRFIATEANREPKLDGRVARVNKPRTTRTPLHLKGCWSAILVGWASKRARRRLATDSLSEGSTASWCGGGRDSTILRTRASRAGSNGAQRSHTWTVCSSAWQS